MISRSKILAIVAAGLLIVTWIFYVAGNASVSWSTNSGSVSGITYSYNYGLWKTVYCYAGNCQESSINCDSNTAGTGCSKLMAARAFMTLACLFTPFAAAYLIFIVIMKKFSRIFVLIAPVLTAICFVFGLIGMVVGINYATDTRGMSVTLGAAAGVSIVGVILNFIALIVTALVRPE